MTITDKIIKILNTVSSILQSTSNIVTEWGRSEERKFLEQQSMRENQINGTSSTTMYSQPEDPSKS